MLEIYLDNYSFHFSVNPCDVVANVGVNAGKVFVGARNAERGYADHQPKVSITSIRPLMYSRLFLGKAQRPRSLTSIECAQKKYSEHVKRKDKKEKVAIFVLRGPNIRYTKSQSGLN